MNPIEVVILSSLLPIVGIMVSWFLARRDKRDERVFASAAPGAPTVQEIWQRQDRMENAFRASLTLLGEIAEQWNEPHPPTLSQGAIKVLRDTQYLPPELDNLVAHPHKPQE